MVRQERVVILSEVGFDTAYFNEDAYKNLLKFFLQNKDNITGLIIDGVVSRLDRPEFLSDLFTYWEKSREECDEVTGSIPNRKQYDRMLRKQMDLLTTRLKEIRRKLPDTKIIVAFDTDDIQFTTSAVLNERLIRGQKKIGEDIAKLKESRREIVARVRYLKRRRKRLSGAQKSGNTRSMRASKKYLEDVDIRIKDKQDERKLYREKKVRPTHQHFTRLFIEELFDHFKTVCDNAGVEMITRSSMLHFGHFVIDYAHSRHRFWTPVKTRDKRILESVLGKMLNRAGEIKGNVDVILESGHHGIGYKQFVKLRDNSSETNFQNQASYNSDMGDKFVTLIMALPFEDQQAISRFVKGQEPIRLSAGKPMGTRSHATFNRYGNEGVSGLTIISKNIDGIIGSEWIQFGNFVDASVLLQPKEYCGFFITSDEHIGSPETNQIVLDGAIEYFRHHARHPIHFRGKKGFLKGYINAGDIAEANSRKWDYRYHYKSDPRKLIYENLSKIASCDISNPDELVKFVTDITNRSIEGSVESMAMIMDWVADYLESYLDICVTYSMLRSLLVVTTGNHASKALKDLGIRETDFFVQRLKALNIDSFQVGNANQDPEARIKIGGYSNAQIVHVPNYGLDVEGVPLFGPINLLVQHDPKGSGFKGVIGAGKRVGADLSIAGHLHNTWVKIYKIGENEFSVAYRVATLQGVTPTEKYYAGAEPRTQAAHAVFMPHSGDFSEFAIPAIHLRDLGLQVLTDSAKQKLGEDDTED